MYLYLGECTCTCVSRELSPYTLIVVDQDIFAIKIFAGHLGDEITYSVNRRQLAINALNLIYESKAR